MTGGGGETRERERERKREREREREKGGEREKWFCALRSFLNAVYSVVEHNWQQNTE